MRASRTELESSAAFPAFTSAANVQTRAVDRHEIQAALTFPAVTATATVSNRMVTRHALTSAKPFPAITSTVDVGSESPVAGAKTFPAFTRNNQCSDTLCNSPCCNGGGNTPCAGKHSNGQRACIAGYRNDNPPRVHGNGQAFKPVPSTRHELTLVKTFPTFTMSATLQTRTPNRSEIQATKTLPCAHYHGNCPVRITTDRHCCVPRVQRFGNRPNSDANRHGSGSQRITYQVLTSTANVRQRILLALAAKTFPAFAATATVQARMPARDELTAAKALPAVSSTVALQLRQPARQELTAATAFPAFITAAELRSESPLTAAKTFSAFTASATVQTRMPARHELTAAKTFPAFTAAPTLLQLEARLTLADFTRTAEYNLDALALITRASTGNVLWNADGSRFGGADVLDAGEIGLGT